MTQNDAIAAARTPRSLPYGRQWIGEAEIQAVVDVLRSDWLTQGPAIERFERAVADRCGARYAVAVANGTAALHAACFAAALAPGDEGIVPPISFAASANCLVYCGATPVFADVHGDLPTLDVTAAAAAVTPRTRVIMAVDYAGHPAHLDELASLARDRGLVLIEDAAHALGGVYNGRPIGGLADLTTFSFHPVKQITTGEGGMVLTNSTEYYERLLLFRTHGITRRSESFEYPDEGPWYYEMQELGFNYRLTDLQCALGLVQLRRLDEFVDRRREIAAAYDRALASLPGVSVLPERNGARSAYHLYPIRIDETAAGPTRRQVFERLRNAGLGVNVHYIPIHLQPFYRRRYGTSPGTFPNAERFYRECISLPLYPRMTDDDVEYVIEAVRSSMAS